MYRRLVLSIGIFCTIISSAQGATTLRPGTINPFRFTIPGSTAQATVVEATSDFKTWMALQTNAAGAANVTVTDSQSTSFSRRFYRVRLLPAALPELAQLTNSVFMPSEGFNALQYAPNGKLGFLVWRGQNLVYRERVSGAWTEQVLGAFGTAYVAGRTEEYRFQPHAALLYDSQSRAHVLRLSGASIVHHLQQSNGSFLQDYTVATSGSSFSLFSAAIGASDKLHVALVGAGTSPAVTYGSNKSGAWQWSQVTTITGNARGFLRQSFAPRWFSMAVDNQNNAHLAFCPQFVMGQSPEGYMRPYSELHYASNASGNWVTQKIADVADGSGDAGAGASIAIGPDNQPAIAAWYNERAPTGSSQFNQLYYHRRQSGGTWSKQLVTGTSAGYIAGDGERGAGFAPYLRFDGQGRPNIAFCDDASQHFSTGQNEYAGDLRHAYFNGSQWVFKTIYRQIAPLDRQIVYPAMALSGTEMTFMGLERKTIWQSDYRVAASTYNWFLVQSPLP